jgi:hypothetical protein
MTSPHESSVADRDSTEIAKRSYRAYVDKDRSAIERLLAEDSHGRFRVKWSGSLAHQKTPVAVSVSKV